MTKEQYWKGKKRYLRYKKRDPFVEKFYSAAMKAISIYSGQSTPEEEVRNEQTNPISM